MLYILQPDLQTWVNPYVKQTEAYKRIGEVRLQDVPVQKISVNQLRNVPAVAYIYELAASNNKQLKLSKGL
jgi:hypothetical protein